MRELGVVMGGDGEDRWCVATSGGKDKVRLVEGVGGVSFARCGRWMWWKAECRRDGGGGRRWDENKKSAGLYQRFGRFTKACLQRSVRSHAQSQGSGLAPQAS